MKKREKRLEKEKAEREATAQIRMEQEAYELQARGRGKGGRGDGERAAAEGAALRVAGGCIDDITGLWGSWMHANKVAVPSPATRPCRWPRSRRR